METVKEGKTGSFKQDDHLWQSVLGEIEVTVSRGNYSTWFKNTRLLKRTDTTLVVGVPNVFIKHQLQSKFNTLISEMLAKNGVSPEQIIYKIYTPALAHKKNEAESVGIEPAAGNDSANQRATRPATSLTHAYRQGLNTRYTFDNFVVGSANDLAYAACQAAAASPGRKYNPLFIYGGVGIGKTHLIQAVGNAILAKKPSAKVVFVSGEQFVQEFIDAVRYRKNTEFANYYRSADVLIVDDIQFIAGKEKTQEDFFHTFNALHQANKQIIISSDKPPKDIPTLTDRLRSRFSWGMAIDMQVPDFETRCAIVQTKAAVSDMELTADVVDYLAGLIQTNIRELEGALNQLLAYSEMRGQAPDLNLAMSLLGSQRSRPKHLTARQVIERTAKYFQISMEDILGPKRDKEIVVPRQIAMYILRHELHMSFPKIARELGRKDHTTAIHSVEKINHEASYNNSLKAVVDEIKGRLYV